MSVGHKHTQETKEKIQKAHLGKKRAPFSKEWREKLSRSLIGNSHTLGHKLTPEHKSKISQKVRGENHPLWGKPHSEESKIKSSKSHMGQKSWNKGVPMSDSAKEKLSKANKNPSEEKRRRLSESHKGIPSFRKGKEYPRMKGEKNPNWKGGITPVSVSVRSSIRMKAYVFDVLRRDKFTCQMCGDDRGGNLEVDHKIPFSFLMQQLRDEYGDENLFAKAMRYEPLWDMDNAQTLCVDCHGKTETFGSKALKYKPLQAK